MTPRISVVMIFLNAERFIADSIASVAMLGRQDWELILVDDGSTDGSTGIAQAAATASGGRIRYFEHDRHANRGMAVSRNRGLHEARGDYVLYLDSDDILFPDALDRLAAPLDADPAIGLSCAATLFWNWDPAIAGDPDRMQLFGEWADRTVAGRDFLAAMIADEGLHPANCSTMIRRGAMLEAGGFDLAFPGIYEDTALMTALLIRHRVHVSRACVSAYRMHLASHCHSAIDAGDYVADRPNAARRRYLDWALAYLREQGALDRRMVQAIDQASHAARGRGPVARLVNGVRHPRKILARVRPRRASVPAALDALIAFHGTRGAADEVERLRVRRAVAGRVRT